MKVEEQRQRRRRWRLGWVGGFNGSAQRGRLSRSLGRRWTAAALAIVVAVGVGWLVMYQFRGPAETVYIAEADTYVTTAHPEANYGTTPTLRADATPKIRSYLRFQLNGLSGRVVYAHLRLWSPTGDLVGYRVHPVANTGWDEREITWRNGPRAGDPVAKSGPFGPGSWSSTDVTRLVEGNDEVSVAMTTRSQQNVTFDSREGSHKPQLVVQTTPAPATARSAASRQWLKSTIETSLARPAPATLPAIYAKGHDSFDLGTWHPYRAEQRLRMGRRLPPAWVAAGMVGSGSTWRPPQPLRPRLLAVPRGSAQGGITAMSAGRVLACAL